MTQEQPELLCCPFCGGTKHDIFNVGRRSVGRRSWRCGCVACGAMTGMHDTEDQAIATWNRRAEVQRLSAPPQGVDEAAMRLAQALNNRQDCEDDAADCIRRLAAENAALRAAIGNAPKADDGTPIVYDTEAVDDVTHALTGDEGEDDSVTVLECMARYVQNVWPGKTALQVLKDCEEDALRAASAPPFADPTDPGNDVETLREHVRHLERRVRQLHAEKAASAPAVPQGWQPIETAPKDGREVLLAVKMRAGTPHGLLVGHYMEGGYCIEDHPPIDRGWYFFNGSMFDRASEPTHWMPLLKHPALLAASPQVAAPAPTPKRALLLAAECVLGIEDPDMTDAARDELATKLRELAEAARASLGGRHD